MSDFIIYHNPKCSKSRQTLELLRSKGVEPKIVEYLKEPPSEKIILEITKMLDIEPQNLVRTKEDLYKELKPDISTIEGIVSLLAAHPKLLERPLVIHSGRAVIGRPPENIETFF